MKRIDELPLLSPDEIARRLKKLRLKVGMWNTAEGPPLISLSCIEKFTGMAHCVVNGAMNGRGPNGEARPSKHTLLTLSHFFARYDAGEISFTFKKGTGWTINFHSDPKPRVTTVAQITIGPEGPKLGFARLNRDWV